MVDVEQRSTARNRLADFFSGKSTNEELVDGFPEVTKDKALKATEFALWHFYDDLRTHKADSFVVLSQDARALLERIWLFLATDLEYEWREVGLHGSWSPLPFALKHGWIPAPLRAKLHVGDYQVWPFFKASDYATALSRHQENLPVFLPSAIARASSRSVKLLSGLQKVIFISLIPVARWVGVSKVSGGSISALAIILIVSWIAHLLRLNLTRAPR